MLNRQEYKDMVKKTSEVDRSMGILVNQKKLHCTLTKILEWLGFLWHTEEVLYIKRQSSKNIFKIYDPQTMGKSYRIIEPGFTKNTFSKVKLQRLLPDGREISRSRIETYWSSILGTSDPCYNGGQRITDWIQ